MISEGLCIDRHNFMGALKLFNYFHVSLSSYDTSLVKIQFPIVIYYAKTKNVEYKKGKMFKHIGGY